MKKTEKDNSVESCYQSEKTEQQFLCWSLVPHVEPPPSPLAADANASVLVCWRRTLASLTCGMQSVLANMDLNLSSMLTWYRMHMASCLWPSSAATQTDQKEGKSMDE